MLVQHRAIRDCLGGGGSWSGQTGEIKIPNKTVALVEHLVFCSDKPGRSGRPVRQGGREEEEEQEQSNQPGERPVQSQSLTAQVSHTHHTVFISLVILHFMLSRRFTLMTKYIVQTACDTEIQFIGQQSAQNNTCVQY